MSTQQILRTRDLNSDGLAFWGVVSGTLTLGQVTDLIAKHGRDTSALRSVLSSRLQGVLHGLAGRRVLDDSTAALPFDANRRCRDCGVVHADHPLVQRSGGTCLRQLWGGPPPLNTAGLRRGGRR